MKARQAREIAEGLARPAAPQHFPAVVNERPKAVRLEVQSLLEALPALGARAENKEARIIRAELQGAFQVSRPASPISPHSTRLRPPSQHPGIPAELLRPISQKPGGAVVVAGGQQSLRPAQAVFGTRARVRRRKKLAGLPRSSRRQEDAPDEGGGFRVVGTAAQVRLSLTQRLGRPVRPLRPEKSARAPERPVGRKRRGDGPQAENAALEAKRIPIQIRLEDPVQGAALRGREEFQGIGSHDLLIGIKRAALESIGRASFLKPRTVDARLTSGAPSWLPHRRIAGWPGGKKRSR